MYGQSYHAIIYVNDNRATEKVFFYLGLLVVIYSKIYYQGDKKLKSQLLKETPIFTL